MITIDNVSKRFGDIQAVDGVTLEAADGRITGLLGPNGAGKTTTLRVLYGLQKPDQGSAAVDGIDVAQDQLSAMARIGVFPDAVGLYDRLSVREHLRFSARLHGLSGARLDQAVQRAVGYFQIDELLDRRCKGFSHGQQMKVALSRALIHEPQNLILDEPSNGLDVMSIRLLRDLLRRLRDDEGKCILFSSHVMAEVSALCDVIYIMANGRVVARGTTQELCDQAGKTSLEDAFIELIGSAEGLAI